MVYLFFLNLICEGWGGGEGKNLTPETRNEGGRGVIEDLIITQWCVRGCLWEKLPILIIL